MIMIIVFHTSSPFSFALLLWIPYIVFVMNIEQATIFSSHHFKTPTNAQKKQKQPSVFSEKQRELLSEVS